MENKESIFHKNLNLAFVYIVVFLFGLLTVFIMTNILNHAIDDVNETMKTSIEQNN